MVSLWSETSQLEMLFDLSSWPPPFSSREQFLAHKPKHSLLSSLDLVQQASTWREKQLTHRHQPCDLLKQESGPSVPRTSNPWRKPLLWHIWHTVPGFLHFVSCFWGDQGLQAAWPFLLAQSGPVPVAALDPPFHCHWPLWSSGSQSHFVYHWFPWARAPWGAAACMSSAFTPSACRTEVSSWDRGSLRGGLAHKRRRKGAAESLAESAHSARV